MHQFPSCLLRVYEATQELAKLRIAGSQMIILTPPGWLESSVVHDVTSYDHQYLVGMYPTGEFKLAGITVVQDEAIVGKIVIRSLISEHRIEIPTS